MSQRNIAAKNAIRVHKPRRDAIPVDLLENVALKAAITFVRIC
jgi:hypothetical protein